MGSKQPLTAFSEINSCQMQEGEMVPIPSTKAHYLKELCPSEAKTELSSWKWRQTASERMWAVLFSEQEFSRGKNILNIIVMLV